MKKYKLVSKKGEGTFSEVVMAENIEDGKHYAIKCMKNSFKNVQQVNNLREIQALRKLAPHPNVVNLEEVLYDEPTGRLAMVFELMDANLYDLISGRRDHLDPELVRNIGYEMFTALKYMHGKSIFHRDIKPENILIDKTGRNLKLADFGSCRSIHSRPPFTEYIATRWYRSPECLLTEGHYGAPMDIWGAGCVLFEITALFPLFPGADEVDQINRIHKVVGTPSKEILMKLRKNKSSKIDFKFRAQNGVGIRHFIPHASLECVDLLTQTLEYDYAKRIGSTEACAHDYFDILHESDKESITQPTKPTAASSRIRQSERKKYSNDDRNEKSSFRRQKENQESKKRLVRVGKKKVAKDNTSKISSEPSKPITNTSKSKKAKSSLTSSHEGGGSQAKLPKNKIDDEKLKKSSKQQSKLPKFDPNRYTKKVQSHTNSIKSKQESSRIGNPVGTRRKKFSNIKSSGYGRTNYKPTRKANPSATSTITEKTAKTAGTSSQISSKSLSHDDDAPTAKHAKTVRSKKQQPIRREPTLTQLPSIR